MAHERTSESNPGRPGAAASVENGTDVGEIFLHPRGIGGHQHVDRKPGGTYGEQKARHFVFAEYQAQDDRGHERHDGRGDPSVRTQLLQNYRGMHYWESSCREAPGIKLSSDRPAADAEGKITRSHRPGSSSGVLAVDSAAPGRRGRTRQRRAR